MRWYIVNAHSNFENKVADAIRDAAVKRGLEEHFGEIVVPTERSIEIRRNKKVEVEHRTYPGYVLVQMDLLDETWSLVKNVPKVTGFLGSHGKPQPLSQREVDALMGRLAEEAAKPMATPSILYEVGESVRVTDGPFNSFTGLVEDVDPEKGRLKVSVSIFGRATNVELEYSQVEKAS